MSEIITAKKYQFAMQQVVSLTDALFTKSAELEMANIRIAELNTKENNNGEQHTGVQDGTAQPTEQHNKSRRRNKDADTE